MLACLKKNGLPSPTSFPAPLFLSIKLGQRKYKKAYLLLELLLEPKTKKGPDIPARSPLNGGLFFVFFPAAHLFDSLCPPGYFLRAKFFWLSSAHFSKRDRCGVL